MNKRILVSLSVIGAVAAVAVGGTIAYFSDTETSTGNTFTAGSLDLKVDSECHYWNITGFDGNDPIYTEVENGCEDGEGVEFGSWSETDLGVEKFFNFADIKPGDKGEDTISLHVYDNDAWGRITMALDGDEDNSCTEPEEESGDLTCGEGQDGELLEAMLPYFSMWLDQGSIPGFQNGGAAGIRDLEEGDNIWQEDDEPSISVQGETMLSSVLASAYENGCITGEREPLEGVSSDGHDDYGPCHGLARDGRMVASTTYYVGLAWELPYTVGNEVQTDSLSGDITFEVEQHRNNPTPFVD